LLLTKWHTGDVRLTVAYAEAEPASDGSNDDIVEIDFMAGTPSLYLAAWAHVQEFELPDLPAGPGQLPAALPRCQTGTWNRSRRTLTRSSTSIPADLARHAQPAPRRHVPLGLAGLLDERPMTRDLSPQPNVPSPWTR
jgi:hypothetical protein